MRSTGLPHVIVTLRDQRKINLKRVNIQKRSLSVFYRVGKVINRLHRLLRSHSGLFVYGAGVNQSDYTSGVANSIIGGGGPYSYIRVLHY